MLNWFATAEAERFAKDQAGYILSQLRGAMDKRDAKFTVKAEKTLIRVDRSVQEFRAREKMNFFKRSKLANTFLWALKDGGCPEDYARELTEWLTYRL